MPVPSPNMMPPLRGAHLFPLLLLLLSTLIAIFIPKPTQALLCYCNECPTEYCETTTDSESACFKSVEKYYDREHGNYSLEPRFGCLSGGTGLGHLQCHANLLRHHTPQFIKCCREDYCNSDLPNPTEQDDPRWNLEPTDQQGLFSKICASLRNLDYDRKIYLAAIALLAISSALLAIHALLIVRRRTTENDDLEKASRSSTCSIKANLEKLYQNPPSSSASTQSYSFSEDPCHKLHHETSDDAIPSLDDLTEGLGQQPFSERTMARGIELGKMVHIGDGRFGRVFKAPYHGEDVAVKIFRTFDQESWKREEDIFKTLCHDNIVRFLKSEITTNGNGLTEIWMILEYCPYGSLCDFLDRNEISSPQQAAKILYSIINGLNYLHEDYAQGSSDYKPSIAHRDIKTKNILMKTPETCCIADFGHALFKKNEQELDLGTQGRIQVGTVRYMAPEILKSHPFVDYSQFITFARADIYQYGLVMWEVLHRTAIDGPAEPHKLPYDGFVPQNPSIQDMLLVVHVAQYRPPRDERWDKHPIMCRLAAWMLDCWRQNPQSRMETLGVKKKLKELCDRTVPLHQFSAYSNSSLSPSFRYDRTVS